MSTTTTQFTRITELPCPQVTPVTERDPKKSCQSKLYYSGRKSNLIKNPSKRNVTSGDYSKPSRGEVYPDRKLHTNAELFGIEKVDSTIKRAGNFLLGPPQGSSPVKSIQPYLARKDGTDEFYVIKILTRKDEGEKETTDDIQGKTLLHTEHSLLSLVRNEDGVIHEHGMFRDTVQERIVNEKGEIITKQSRRLCLVLDCYVAHDFSPKYSNITNMQCHVIKEKKLPESEAIRIFCKVVQIVERLHKLNIVHRDLKLGNIILNKDSREVTLANFCLGKHLSSDNDLLKDQRGSPAYISPDVISGKPYLGKPSDMWALGVVLYTMLFGQFPFYDQSPTELFRKIKLGEFQIPVDVNVNKKTEALIKSLLVLDPKKRLTASEALKCVRSIIADEQSLMSDSDLQVVPDCHPGAEKCKKRRNTEHHPDPLDLATEVANYIAKYDELPEVEEKEPQRKKLKQGTKLPDLINQFTLDEQQLQRIHAMYVARKITEAASRAKISPRMINEELTNHLSSNSSNGLIKSASPNADSACVPSGDASAANPQNLPTCAGDLDGKVALLSNNKALQKNRTNTISFFSVPVPQMPF